MNNKPIVPCATAHCRHYGLANGVTCKVEAARRQGTEPEEGPDRNWYRYNLAGTGRYIVAHSLVHAAELAGLTPVNDSRGNEAVRCLSVNGVEQWIVRVQR